MSARLHFAVPLALLGSLLAACNVGVIPRDVPPPEAPPTAEPAEPAEPAPAAETPAPKQYQLDGNRLELPGPIVFAAGSDAPDPASDPALEHARGYLAAKDSISTLRIEGHAEDQGLSERRAVAVGRWLVAHGVDCKRLIAVGFGPSKPLVAADSPEAPARNTRVELHNAALRGRPIGGASPDGGGQVASADLCR